MYIVTDILMILAIILSIIAFFLTIRKYYFRPELNIENRKDEEKEAIQKPITWETLLPNQYDKTLLLFRRSILRKNIESIIKNSSKRLNAEGGKLYIKSGSKSIKLMSLFNLSDSEIKIGDVINYNTGKGDEGVAGMVMESGKSLIVNDYKKWKGSIKKYAHLFSTVIEVPIELNNETIGVLSLFNGREFQDNDIKELKKCALNISFILGKTLLEEQHKQLLQENQLLKNSYEYISHASSWGEVTHKILEAANNLFPFSRATLQRIKGDGRELVAMLKMPEDLISKELLGAISLSPLISKIIETREPVIISNTKYDKTGLWHNHPETRDVKSWASIPLVYEDEVIAIITLDHTLEYDFYRGIKINLLKLFGKHAAVVLKTYEKSLNQKKINEAINKIHEKSNGGTTGFNEELVEQFKDKLSANRCTLYMAKKLQKSEAILEPVKTFSEFETKESFAIKSGEGEIGKVFEQGEIKIINYTIPQNSPGRHIRSKLIVPLKVNMIPIGVLSIENEYERWFNKDDEEFAKKVTLNIATYINQLNSFEELLSLGYKITNAQSLKESFELIVSAAVEVTRIQASAIIITETRLARKHKMSRPIIFPENVHIPSPRLKKGLTKKAFESGEFEKIDNAFEDSLAHPGLKKEGIISNGCIPIMKNKKGIAALYVYFYGDKPCHFTNQEIAIFKLLGLYIKGRLLNGSIEPDLISKSFDDLEQQGYPQLAYGKN